jgi:hypothetical protein
MENNKFKLLSQANLCFKSNYIIKACELYKTIIADYSEDDNLFYNLVFSSIMDNFFNCSNKDRFLIINLISEDLKQNFDLKPEHSQKLCQLLECTDYVTRILSMKFISSYFLKGTLDNKIKITLSNRLSIKNLHSVEAEEINLFINYFSSDFINVI